MKKENFIKNLIHKVRYLVDKSKSFHEKLKHSTIDGGNPYRLFLVWLLGVVEYGLLFTVTYSVFVGFDSIVSALIAIPAFGIARYLVLDFAGDLSINLRKKH